MSMIDALKLRRSVYKIGKTLPENYVLVAQMPFGGIVEPPAPKAGEDISLRVRVER